MNGNYIVIHELLLFMKKKNFPLRLTFRYVYVNVLFRKLTIVFSIPWEGSKGSDRNIYTLFIHSLYMRY